MLQALVAWPVRLGAVALALLLALGPSDPLVVVVVAREQTPTAVDHARQLGASRFVADGHGYIQTWDTRVTTPSPPTTRVVAVALVP